MAETPKPKAPAVKQEIDLEWGHAGDVRLHIDTIDPSTGYSAARTTLHFKDPEHAENMLEYVLGEIRKGRPAQTSALPL